MASVNAHARKTFTQATPHARVGQLGLDYVGEVD